MSNWKTVKNWFNDSHVIFTSKSTPHLYSILAGSDCTNQQQLINDIGNLILYQSRTYFMAPNTNLNGITHITFE